MAEEYLNNLFSGDDGWAEQAVERLAALPAEQRESVIERLAGYLSDPDAERRWWAARALAAQPVDYTPELAARLAKALAGALSDPVPDVRQCAALGLRSHPSAESLPALVQALDDPDPLTARLAADALIAIGNEAVPALIETLKRTSPEAPRLLARLNAARALATIGDTRAVPALFEALNSDSALMEYYADLGLERMGVGTAFFLPD